MNDLFVSWIRTGVAIAAGAAVSWAVRHSVPVADLDQAKAAAYVTPVCIAGYYAAVRTLEKRWPQLGRLFGIAQQPKYEAPQAA